MRAPGLVVLVALVGLGGGCSDDAGDDPIEATGSPEEFCAELRAVVEADLTIFDPLQPAGPEETREATARLAEAAPEAVATEMHLLADTFAAVTDVLAEVDPSDPEAGQRLEDLEIDQDEIAAAQEAVTGYARDECSIDLAAINDASVTVPSTTAPPATAPSTTLPSTSGPATTIPTTSAPPVE